MSEILDKVAILEQLSLSAETHVNDDINIFRSKIDAIKEFAVKTDYQEAHIRSMCFDTILLFRNHEYDSSFKLAHETLTLALEASDIVGISKSLHAIGNIYYSKGQLLNALEEYHNAYATLLLANEAHRTYPLLYNIANCYRRLGENKTALEFANKAYFITTQTNSPQDVTSIKLLLGAVHASLDDYPLSLQFFLSAYAEAKKNKDEITSRWALSGIGLTYIKIEDYTTALHYLMECMSLAEKANDHFLLTDIYRYISQVFREQKSQALALNYSMRSLAFNEKRGEIVKQAYDLGEIALLFFQLGENDSAREYADKSLSLHCSESITVGEIQMLQLLSKIALKAKNYEEANILIHKAYNKSKSARVSLHRRSLDLLFDLYSSTRDTERLQEISYEREQLIRIDNIEIEKGKVKKILLEAEVNKVKEDAENMLRNFTKKNILTNEMYNKVSGLDSDVITSSFKNQDQNLTESPTRITVTTLGKFSVTLDNDELTSEQWKRKKARDIFKILLLHYRQPVSIDELIEILWQDTSIKNIIPTIWNSVSYIRKALEPGIKPFTPSSYIGFINKNYILDFGDNSFIDFIEFKKLIQQSETVKELDNSIQLLEKAMQLYCGDFLKEDIFEEWSSFERENLKDTSLKACCKLSNYYLNTNNFSKSAEFSRKALTIDNIYDEAHKLLLKCLKVNGNDNELRKAWQFCINSYSKELNSSPPSSLQQFAQS